MEENMNCTNSLEQYTETLILDIDKNNENLKTQFYHFIDERFKSLKTNYERK